MKKLTRFLANAWHELMRVKWPTMPQVARYTVAVLFVIAFFALISYSVTAIMAYIIEQF